MKNKFLSFIVAVIVTFLIFVAPVVIFAYMLMNFTELTLILCSVLVVLSFVLRIYGNLEE